MVRRDDLAGATSWSLRLLWLPNDGLMPWSLAGMKYRKGLPQLVHLEQGAMVAPESCETDVAACDALFQCSSLLRCR